MMLPVLILGLFCVGSARAGCTEDLAGDSTFQGCLGAFTSVLSQGDDMMAAMCSPTFQENFKCVARYLSQCPEMERQMRSMGIGAIMDQVPKLQSACAVLTGPCAEVQKCLEQAGGPDPSYMGMSTSTASPTQGFSNMLTMIAEMCMGSTKAKYDCFVGKQDECPELVKVMEDNMGHGAVLDFIQNECPKLPPSIATNGCVKRKLDSPGVTMCFGMMMTDQSLSPCQQYLGQQKCVRDAVGPCGEVEADVLAKATTLHMAAPENCVAPDGSGSSGGGSGGDKTGSMGEGSGSTSGGSGGTGTGSTSGGSGGTGSTGGGSGSDGAGGSGSGSQTQDNAAGAAQTSVLVMFLAAAMSIVWF